MLDDMKNCWEIMNCGRENGGPKVSDLGECIASKVGLGHTCWAVAGTLCGGAIQGSIAQKESDCMRCGVYQHYNRVDGSKGPQVAKAFPREEAKYIALLMNRVR